MQLETFARYVCCEEFINVDKDIDKLCFEKIEKLIAKKYICKNCKKTTNLLVFAFYEEGNFNIYFKHR